MTQLWHSAFISLGRRRLRTALTVAGIAIGTALVVLISGIGAVGESAIQQELECMGIDGLSVSASEGLTLPCLTHIRELPMVTRAMPLLLRMGEIVVGRQRYATVSCGVDAGADQVISLELLCGRLLTQGDIVNESPVCVIDESLAKEAFGRQNAVGQSITLVMKQAVLELEIVGVTATGSSLLQTVTSMIPYMIYTPYTMLQTAVGVDTFDQIAVRISSPEKTADAQQAIERALAEIPEDIGRLMTENLASQRERLDSMMSILSVILTSIGGVSLLVSGFGIMTVMLSAVHERTKEIGIKKAIGASKLRILAEFLMGAFILSLMGTLAGMAIGLAVYAGGCTLLGMTPVWEPDTLIGVTVLTLGLGVLCGAYPAYQAAGLRPVDALRQD